MIYYRIERHRSSRCALWNILSLWWYTIELKVTSQHNHIFTRNVIPMIYYRIERRLSIFRTFFNWTILMIYYRIERVIFNVISSSTLLRWMIYYRIERRLLGENIYGLERLVMIYYRIERTIALSPHRYILLILGWSTIELKVRELRLWDADANDWGWSTIELKV